MSTRMEISWRRKEKALNSSTMDRISELPEHLIHHILSFVPTVDAIRMSVLSRRWRWAWHSVPTLIFSELDFRCKKSFYMFVEHCMALRSLNEKFGLTSFKLKVRCYSETDRPEVNKWLKSPIIRRDCVKELDICALLYHEDLLGQYKNLIRPSVALSGTSLSVVKLKNLNLVNSCSINLPLLKTLFLKSVTFDNDVNETLHNLITRSPSLEKFVFRLRYDIRIRSSKIKISSSSLKDMEIEIPSTILDIDTLNLQSLVFHNCCYTPNGLSLCTAIRDLSLHDLHNCNGQHFEDQIPNLTCLETLSLTIDRNLGHTSIVNATLKYLYVSKRTTRDCLTVTTETPNLVSFNYRGDMGFRITMASTPNPRLSGNFAFLSPYRKEFETDYWYKKLMTFFSEHVNCLWNSLHLFCNEEKAFIIPETMRKTLRPLWPHLKHLKVTFISRLTRKSELQNSLEWLSPSLETLSIEDKSKISLSICFRS